MLDLEKSINLPVAILIYKCTELTRKLGFTEVPQWYKCKGNVLSTKNQKHHIIKNNQEVNINQQQGSK